MKNLKVIEHRLGRAKQGLKEIKNFDIYQDFGFEGSETSKEYVIIKLKQIAADTLKELNKIKEK